jgi:hypothetical protein
VVAVRHEQERRDVSDIATRVANHPILSEFRAETRNNFRWIGDRVSACETAIASIKSSASPTSISSLLQDFRVLVLIALVGAFLFSGRLDVLLDFLK